MGDRAAKMLIDVPSLVGVAERYSAIEKHNRMLLAKMERIMKQKGTLVRGRAMIKPVICHQVMGAGD